MTVTREVLAEAVKVLAPAIAEGMPDGVGFALVLFDFGDEGSIAYAGNGQRQQLLQVLRELADKMELAGQ